MARFIFSLEAVLTQRRHAEQQRQRELAAAEGQLTALHHELQKMNEAMQQSTGDLRGGRLTGRLDMEFLAAFRRYAVAMQRKAVALAQRIALAQRQVDAARAALLDAARQRKIIEKLKEKQQQRWREDQSRRELAQLDEIGMQLAYARLGGEP